MTASSRCGPDWLHDKLLAGKQVLIDGATGTELESRGVPMDDKATSIADTDVALALAKHHWSGPLGVYPESGYFTMPN